MRARRPKRRRYNADGFLWSLPILLMPAVAFPIIAGFIQRCRGIHVLVLDSPMNKVFDACALYGVLLGALLFFPACWRALSLFPPSKRHNILPREVRIALGMPLVRRGGIIPISVKIALAVPRIPWPLKPIAALIWFCHWCGVVLLALIFESIWVDAFPGGFISLASINNIMMLFMGILLAYLFSLIALPYLLTTVATFARRRRVLIAVWRWRHVLASTLSLITLCYEFYRYVRH